MKRTAGSRRALVVLCAVGFVLGVPAIASAAIIRVESGHFIYEALPGEANHPAQLHYDVGEGRWTFFELPAFPSAGGGCESDPNPAIVYCEGSEEPLTATIDLGDQDDWYQQSVYFLYDSQTETTTEVPVDEPFSQTVDAGPGNDNFWASATGSPTTFSGGPGDDRFTFFTARPDTTPTPPDTYQLLGGEGDDTMEVPWGAPPSPPPPGGEGVTMEGGPGADTIRGSKGSDAIDGGEGNDNLLDLPGNDVVNGEAGDDQLYGGEGDDIENGGEGNDWIQAFGGSNRIDGGPGNDTVMARASGEPDEVSCGTGVDQVLPDPGIDVIDTDCERIIVPESCESGLGCTDTITVTAATSSLASAARPGRRPPRRLMLGRTRFKLQGHTSSGKLPLSHWGRSYIQSHGPTRVLRTTRIVRPRGHRPPKVTVRRIRLTLRS